MSHPKVPARALRGARPGAAVGRWCSATSSRSTWATLGYPDLVAEIADLLLSYEGARFVLCLGQYGE